MIWIDAGFTMAGRSALAIHVDNLTIDCKRTAPSKLYWAGRARSVRIVQAIHWLINQLECPS